MECIVQSVPGMKVYSSPILPFDSGSVGNIIPGVMDEDLDFSPPGMVFIISTKFYLDEQSTIYSGYQRKLRRAFRAASGGSFTLISAKMFIKGIISANG